MTKEKGFCRALALTSQNRKYTGVLGNKRQQLNNYYKYILLKLTHTHTKSLYTLTTSNIWQKSEIFLQSNLQIQMISPAGSTY